MSFEPPETARYDRVTIIAAETEAHADTWAHLDGEDLKRYKYSLAVECAEKFVAEAQKRDLFLFQEWPSETDRMLQFRIKAAFLDMNHSVVRDAAVMAKDIVEEIKEEMPLRHGVHPVTLRQKLMDKLVEILHNEKE